jgi:predicted ATP-grasp superfamily ATP-dependent carboligase
LEKTGVIDALTKVLVGLYEEPERPVNAIDYIKRYMGAPQNVDVDALKRENESLRLQVDKLSKQMEEIKRLGH